MRNLKRALSLALASAMLMGMMVVGTSASFTDSETYDNITAVEVLSALEVLNGYDDGSFKGENVVTRAELAKILVCLTEGASYDVSGFVGFGIFSDTDGHWADGYIAKCVSKGYILGYDDGSFKPDAIVTTAEACIMLSRVLGEFKAGEDTGSMWALNGIVTATDSGILTDSSLSALEGLTRDDVAQMAFNLLMSEEYVTYSSDDDAYTAVDNAENLAKSVFGLEGSDTTDTMGRPATKYEFDDIDDVIVSDLPDYTFVGENDFTDDIDDEIDADYYTTLSTEYDTNTTSSAYSTSLLAGEIMEVYTYTYDTDKTGAYVVVYSYATASVTKVTYVSDDDVTKVYVSSSKYITLDGDSSEFAVDDVVVYTLGTDNQTIDEMYIAEVVTGTATAKATGYIKVDGVQYYYANSTSLNNEPDLGYEATAILDPNGYILDIDGVSEAGDEYVYVYAYAEGTAGLSNGQAKIVFMDGSSLVVTVDDDDSDIDSSTLIATYTVSDDVYTLTATVDTVVEEDGQTNDAKITAGDTTVYVDGSSGDIDVTLDTVFVDVEEGVAYVGIEEVPTISDAEYVYVTGTDYQVFFITAYGSSSSTTTDGTIVYVNDASDVETQLGTDGEVYKVYNDAYVDGELMADGLWIDDGESALTSATVYILDTVNDAGYVTSVVDSGIFDETSVTVTMISSTKIYGGAQTFSYDDDTVFVVVDDTDFVSTNYEDVSIYVADVSDVIIDADVDTGDDTCTLSVDYDSDYYATTVYIIIDEKGA